MIKLLLNRVMQLLTVILGVGVLAYLMMRALPGDMAYRIAAGRYGQDNVNATAAALVKQELNLDVSIFQGLRIWLAELLQLNLGRSLVSGEPVIDMVWHQLGHSLVLAIAGIVISLLIAIPVGLWAAKTSSRYNKLILWGSIAIKASPVFVVGIVLVALFSIHLKLFPVAGFGDWRYLVLPAMALGISLAAVSNRIIYTSAKAVFNSSYYQFSQLKGLSERQTFFRHGLRNIAAPVVAFIGIQFVQVIEGIIMLESLFSWPGIGHGLAHAIFARDIPVIQGTALMMGFLFVVLNTLTDIANYYIDPRGAGG